MRCEYKDDEGGGDNGRGGGSIHNAAVGGLGAVVGEGLESGDDVGVAEGLQAVRLVFVVLLRHRLGARAAQGCDAVKWVVRFTIRAFRLTPSPAGGVKVTPTRRGGGGEWVQKKNRRVTNASAIPLGALLSHENSWTLMGSGKGAVWLPNTG